MQAARIAVFRIANTPTIVKMPARAEIDLNKVREFAMLGCTIEEIATLVGVTPPTMYNRADVKAAIAEGKANLCKSLRKRQVDVAMDGNPAMLTWLGKNLLNQTDKQEVNTNLREIHVRIGGPQLSEPEEGDDAAEI